MSIGNGFSPTYGFNVDPDNRQDRKSSEVIIRKMTDEEIEKYKNVGAYKKPSMVAIPNMVRKDINMKSKINEERLLEICKDGFTANSYRAAAKEFGVSVHTVQCYVSKNKLHGKIENQPSDEILKESVKVQSKEEIPESNNSNPEAVIKKVMASNSSVVDAELEILSKIKSILAENKELKENQVKIKSALEEILKLIA